MGAERKGCLRGRRRRLAGRCPQHRHHEARRPQRRRRPADDPGLYRHGGRFCRLRGGRSGYALFAERTGHPAVRPLRQNPGSGTGRFPGGERLRRLGAGYLRKIPHSGNFADYHPGQPFAQSGQARRTHPAEQGGFRQRSAAIRADPDLGAQDARPGGRAPRRTGRGGLYLNRQPDRMAGPLPRHHRRRHRLPIRAGGVPRSLRSQARLGLSLSGSADSRIRRRGQAVAGGRRTRRPSRRAHQGDGDRLRGQEYRPPHR